MCPNHPPDRPYPFWSTHEWANNCDQCAFDHRCEPSNQPHCQKCGIDMKRARERADDINPEACPIREVNTCSICKKIVPIPVEAPGKKNVCTMCLYPNTPVYNTAEEALKAMLDINAGVEPDPPSPKKNHILS